MTRRRMYNTIKQHLEDYQLPVTEESKDVVNTAVDCALEYVLDYATRMAEQLVSDGAYSEAMVAGTFVNKIKALLGE